MHHRRSWNSHRTWLWLLVAWRLASGAEPDRVSIDFDIPAGDAAKSLHVFARQAGYQLLYPSARIAGRQAPAIHGRRSESEVIRILAAAAGLRVVSNDNRTITLAAAAVGGPP